MHRCFHLVTFCLCEIDGEWFCCRVSMCPSLESAVGDAGRESAEAERQRAGAQRHEEDDGWDEGWLAELYLSGAI